MSEAAPIQSLEDVRTFLLAGHAKFTIVSKVTGARRTFEVVQADDASAEGPWFVRLLIGPDNTNDFCYAGCIWRRETGDLDFRARAGKAESALAHVAMGWLVRALNWSHVGAVASAFHAQTEVWHAGLCGRCGRELTDPASIARGLGPVCAEREVA